MLTKNVNGIDVALSAAEESDVLAEWQKNDPANQLPAPNVSGFISGLKSAMGGIVASNTLAKAYPLFYPALETGVFADAQSLIIDAHASGVLGDIQYAAFKTLAAQFNIPISLP